MSALYATTVVVFLVAVFATLTNAARACRGRSRRLHYAITAAISGYAAIVYGLALLSVLDLRAVGPDYLRPLMVLILGSMAAGAIAHWREDER